jgi:ATP-dependent exoDNAse (exonuclease V) alpha subunit
VLKTCRTLGRRTLRRRPDRRPVRSAGPSGEHPHIEHGYALTAHKAQGVSVERAYVLAHESLSAREWSYVAGSRARDTVHLYAERHTADDLERIMGRSHKKDTALSYEPVSAVPTSTPAATRTPPVLGLER